MYAETLIFSTRSGIKKKHVPTDAKPYSQFARDGNAVDAIIAKKFC